jgi:hypothetical protein
MIVRQTIVIIGKSAGLFQIHFFGDGLSRSHGVLVHFEAARD